MPSEVWSQAFAHPAEELLEEYCFHRLQEPTLSRIEEHLLVCSGCRSELEEMGAYITLVKAAATEYRNSLVPDVPLKLAKTSWFGLHLFSRKGAEPNVAGTAADTDTSVHPLDFPQILLWPRLIGVGIATLAVLFIGLTMSPWSKQNFPAGGDTKATVLLTAMRGGAVPSEGTVAQRNEAKPTDASESREPAVGRGFAHANSQQSLNLVIDFHSSPANTHYRLALVDTTGEEVWTGSMQPQGNLLSANVAKRLKAGLYWARLYSGQGDLLREFGLQLD